MTTTASPTGVRAFAVIWIGQVVSLFGSALARFGLGVWVFRETGSIFDYGLIALLILLPGTLLSPLAGVLVDRWNRRTTLIGSDAVSALSILVLWLLANAGRLDVWHVYAAVVVASIAGAFQAPALTAVTPLLVPRHHLARVNGLVHAALAGAQVLAPMLGGALFARSGLPHLLAIDIVTFGAAVLALLAATIPAPPPSAAGAAARGSLWRQAGFGWHYIRQRRGLLHLLLLFSVINLCLGMMHVLLTPMVYSFGGARVLGGVLATAALATALGGLTIGIWGGGSRRVRSILVLIPAGAACLAITGLRPDPLWVGCGVVGFYFTIPIINGVSQAIWQSQVETDVLGRVIATRRVVATLAVPLAYLFGSQIADRVFEPLMAETGALAGTVGHIIGVGEGRGAALLLILVALAMFFPPLFALRSAPLRQLDQDDGLVELGSGAVPET